MIATLLLGAWLGALSQAQLSEIHHALSTGRVADALALLEPLTRAYPNDPLVAGLLGRARLHAGDAAGAVAPLERSLRKLSNDGEGFNNLGVALMQLNRVKKAAQAFARAVVLRPRDPQSWRNLAGAYTNLDRRSDAAKAWARYTSFVPADGEARCVYGGVLLELERVRDAAVHLRAGSKTASDSVCLHDYADALGRLGEHDEALKILTRLIRLDPKNAHAHYLRAYILVGQTRHAIPQGQDAALKAIKKALSLAPKRAANHHLHGYILGVLGRHEEALKAHGRARDLAPKDARYQAAEAIARVRVGEGGKVFKQLRVMVRQDPENLEARRALAHVYMARRQWKKAERLLRQAPGAPLSARLDLAVVLATEQNRGSS